MVQVSRRDFAKGAMGLFGWGMFAGGFSGCHMLSKRTGPNLVFGTISDIHIRLARKDVMASMFFLNLAFAPPVPISLSVIR